MAGKYPDRCSSVVINCAAAKLGFSGPARLQELDRPLKLEGPGSRVLAELIAWQACRAVMATTDEGRAGVDVIQQILRDANEDRVMSQACESMNAMDNRDTWAARSPPRLSSSAGTRT